MNMVNTLYKLKIQTKLHVNKHDEPFKGHSNVKCRLLYIAKTIHKRLIFEINISPETEMESKLVILAYNQQQRKTYRLKRTYVLLTNSWRNQNFFVSHL